MYSKGMFSVSVLRVLNIHAYINAKGSSQCKQSTFIKCNNLSYFISLRLNKNLNLICMVY